MLLRARLVRVVLLGVAAALLALPTIASAQGFGLFKKNVVLQRTLPPVVDLSGNRVAVRLTGVDGRSAAVGDLLRAKLVALVFSNSEIAEDAANPDRVIEVTLTEFYSNSHMDPADGSQLVKGTIRAAYRTIDSRTKQSLDAKNVSYDYEQRFAKAVPAQTKPSQPRSGKSSLLGKLSGKIGGALEKLGAPPQNPDRPPTPDELMTELVEALAVQVAQRVTLTKERLKVPLPRGKLDRAAELGTAGRWGAMLEELEQMPPLPAAEDAYRVYGMGVANEALAYNEVDREKQRDLVARAAQEYKTALTMNAEERILREAETRIAQSLTALDQTAALEDSTAGRQETGASRDGVGTTGSGSGGAEAWDNAAVIALFREGFKEPELVEAIREAPKPKFDAESPKGLLELKRAGVPESVIRAMRERMKKPSDR